MYIYVNSSLTISGIFSLKEEKSDDSEGSSSDELPVIDLTKAPKTVVLKEPYLLLPHLL